MFDVIRHVSGIVYFKTCPIHWVFLVEYTKANLQLQIFTS